MNKYYIICSVLFITSMVSLYALLHRIKETKFGDAKTHEDCAKTELELILAGNGNNGDTCAVWYDPDCYKGSIGTNVDGVKVCNKGRDFLPMIYGLLFLVGLVGSIICFALGVMKKNDIVKKNG